MSRSMRSVVRVTARLAATAVVGAGLVGVAGVAANATTDGVITVPYGSGYPTYSTCYDAVSAAAARQGADDWYCSPHNGGWDGYLTFYT